MALDHLVDTYVQSSAPREPTHHLSAKRWPKLVDADNHNMRGNHDAAVDICRELLNRQNDGADRAFLVVKLATYLDNAGRHREAFSQLDALLRDEGGAMHVKTSGWARYHHAICLRRLGQHENAAAELQRLVESGGVHAVAARHQLGVCHLERAARMTGRVRLRWLRDAEELFEQSRNAWESAADHRQGFSIRRLAQIYALQGRRQEAFEAYVDAFRIFTIYGCHRYADETRVALLTLCTDALKSVKVIGPTRTVVCDRVIDGRSAQYAPRRRGAGVASEGSGHE